MDRKTLAGVLCLRDVEDYPAGTCVAWMDAADKVCGRPAQYLCARHEKVAARRLRVEVTEDQQRRERAAQARQARRLRVQAELDAVQARLDRIDPLRTEAPADRAMVNAPLSSRLPRGRRIAELAQLHRRRQQLSRELEMGE